MAEFLDSDVLKTIAGGVLMLFLLVLILKIGPLRFVGEMLAHLAFKIVFLVIAFGVLFLFAGTELGKELGGVSTGLIIVFAAPFVFLIGAGVHAWMKRKPKAGPDDENTS